MRSATKSWIPNSLNSYQCNFHLSCFVFLGVALGTLEMISSNVKERTHISHGKIIPVDQLEGLQVLRLQIRVSEKTEQEYLSYFSIVWKLLCNAYNERKHGRML